MTAPVRRISSPANGRVSRIGWRLAPLPWRKAVPYAAFLGGFSLIMIPLLGPIAVLSFFGFGGVICVLEPRKSMRLAARFWPLLLFPVLAMLSSIWSEAPHVTLRAAVQLFISFLLTILICGFLSSRAILRMILIGSALLCISAIPNLQRALLLGVPLTSSALGSKNQVGFAAYILFAVACAVAIDPGQRRVFRVSSIGLIVLALLFGHLSKSGGGVVSVLLTALLFPIFVLLSSLRPQGRTLVTFIGLILSAVAMLFRENINGFIATFRTDVLEKNDTLTGRTYLWDAADRIYQAKPILGHGYASFWRHGNLDAEALWRWGGIANRSGFNFHNMFLETKIDLGLVGLVFLVATCIGILAAAVWRQLRWPNKPFAFFVTAVCVLFFRATVENGLIAQFSLSTLILLATAVHSRSRPTGSATLVRRGENLPAGVYGHRAGAV